MKHYKISTDELMAFAQKIYDEGCHGYLDLKESFCESAMQEFVKEKKELPPELAAHHGYAASFVPPPSAVGTTGTGSLTYASSGSVTISGNSNVWTTTSDPSFAESRPTSGILRGWPGATTIDPNVTISDRDLSYQPESENISEQNHPIMRDDPPMIREDLYMRPDTFIRDEGYFQGNESERH